MAELVGTIHVAAISEKGSESHKENVEAERKLAPRKRGECWKTSFISNRSERPHADILRRKKADLEFTNLGDNVA